MSQLPKGMWEDAKRMTEWGVPPARVEAQLISILKSHPELDRTCDTCHAQPGQLCITSLDKPSHKVHAPRLSSP